MSINDDILYKVDSEIGKDKKVVELQKEIERLKEENKKYNKWIESLNKDNHRLNNIINELEKALDENVELTYVRNGKRQYNKTLTEGGLLFRDYIKSKLQELKGEKE